MSARILLRRDASDAVILAAVDQWAALLEAEQYQTALEVVEHDPSINGTMLRDAITQYGDAKPSQKVTLEGMPTDVSQRKRVHRFHKNVQGYVGTVWYDLNINGRASDLTATFGLRVDPDGLMLVLEDVRVM